MDEQRASDGQAAGPAFDATTAAMMPQTQVSRLHLLRHGEVEEFGERRVRGQQDVPLSERGREQTRRLSTRLASAPPIDALVSSDISRCRLLAEACGAALGLEPIYDARLREQSMGDWQGHSWAELSRAQDERVRAYWADPVAVAPPGGESLQVLHARVEAWLEEALSRWAGGRLVIVTHVGPIRAVLCRALGLGPGEALRFAPAVASHTELLVAEAGWVVNALGEQRWRFEPEPAP